MKHLYLTVIACFMLAATLRSQVTITGADLPSSGKGFIISMDTTTSVNIGSPSATAQNWNFQGLQNHGIKFAAYSANHPYLPYYSTFSQANIYLFGYAGLYGCLTGGLPLYASFKGYTYLKSDSAGLQIIGFRNDKLYNNTPVLESPTEMLMKTPFSYDSTYSNFSRWTYFQNLNPYDIDDTLFVFRITKTFTVDAFGTIYTPYDTFSVIRVHEYVITADSIEIKFMGTTYACIPFGIDTVNNYYFWAKDVGFPVAKASCDKYNNLKSIEYISGIFPIFNLSGRVFSTDGITPINTGTVSMILKDSYNHLFDFYETTLINTGGYFRFSDMPYSNFLIYADPNTLQYPHLVPTYYGDEIHWQDAANIFLFSDSLININLRNDSLQTPGSGQISGKVIPYSAGKSVAVNADKIKVILEENSGGATRAHADVSSNGDYIIPDIANGNYKVYIEIPGLNMSSIHYINITNDTAVHNHIDYLYDTLVIFKDPHYGVEPVFSFSKWQVKTMPNPFTDHVKFCISGERFDAYDIKIYDLCGKCIYSGSGPNNSEIEIKGFEAGRGLYMYKIFFDKRLGAAGKIVRY
ncbi:MAG: T9SS type A sorting domain-containing protein [Bacteroidia bacterium]|nr:T9SS type A sorting domain-containing protein [Bacteroidia bacterium]